MTNNDILRKLRYTFNYNDDKMVQLFANAGVEVKREEVTAWLKKEDAEGYVSLYDKSLAQFLNGFIIEKRGKKDDTIPVAEKSLNNNIIFRKLKIALSFRDEDILEVMELADMRVSKPELSAFFRDPEHKHYRMCKDQFLRIFLMGLQLKLRGKAE